MDEWKIIEKINQERENERKRRKARHAIPEFFDKFPIFNQEFFKESAWLSELLFLSIWKRASLSRFLFFFLLELCANRRLSACARTQ